MASICFHQSVHSQKWAVSNYLLTFNLILSFSSCNQNSSFELAWSAPAQREASAAMKISTENCPAGPKLAESTWVSTRHLGQNEANRNRQKKIGNLATYVIQPLIAIDHVCNRGRNFDPQKLYTHLPSPGDSVRSHAVVRERSVEAEVHHICFLHLSWRSTKPLLLM